jgi:hypothetical protein
MTVLQNAEKSANEICFSMQRRRQITVRDDAERLRRASGEMKILNFDGVLIRRTAPEVALRRRGSWSALTGNDSSRRHRCDTRLLANYGPRRRGATAMRPRRNEGAQR